MSDIIDAAVAALNEKLGGGGLDGSAKFVIEGEGSVRIDENGAEASDADADVTLTADAETFQELLAGQLDAMSAFASQRLKVEGNMGMAMQLNSVLS